MEAGGTGRGREHFARRAWSDAYDELTAAGEAARLEPDDLERLAVAAYMMAREQESASHWEQAYRGLLRRGDRASAARCAAWLAFGLLESGQAARGSGWLARARRLVDSGCGDCTAAGYLLLPVALACLEAGDHAGAEAATGEAARIAERFGDADLACLVAHLRGRLLIRLGRIAEAVTPLDEAMVAVTAGELSAMVAGSVYCGVIDGCLEIFDVARAREWTAALTGWCRRQRDAVRYRGPCLVHRAEILLLDGEWAAAAEAADRAVEAFRGMPDQPPAGGGHYLRAELHRLCGELPAAEEAYRRASRVGWRPEPGLALLRLAQARVEAAVAAIRLAADRAPDRPWRWRLLAASVEILLAAGDADAARTAARELAAVAGAIGAPLLRGAAAQAGGALLLHEGQPRKALPALGEACAIWQDLEMPYETARAREPIGLACRELGDEDTAGPELDAAYSAFRRLGAAPDAGRVRALSRPRATGSAGGLTERELQVLGLVAAGKTNRAIATELFLSEKTVARHVSNILTKLGLPSRAAATAHAYRHDLIPGPDGYWAVPPQSTEVLAVSEP